MSPLRVVVVGLSVLALLGFMVWSICAANATGEPGRHRADRVDVGLDILKPPDPADLPDPGPHRGEFAGVVDDAVLRGQADYDFYRIVQHLPGEHHYTEESRWFASS